MTQHRFDCLSGEVWKAKIEQLLKQHHTDIIRLMRERDQRPREWYGLPPHAADAFDGVSGVLSSSFIIEGVLDDDLNPSTNDGSTETTATLSIYSGEGDDWGDSGENIQVTNRDDGFSAKSGERLVVWATPDQEYRPLLFPPILRLGKTDSAHNKGNSGTISIYVGTAGSESDSGDNVSSYNHFADLATTKYVVTARIAGNEYLVAGEC